MSLAHRNLDNCPTLLQLHGAYADARRLDISREQFVYIVALFPGLSVVLSDGWMDQEEWVTVKKMARVLGTEFTTNQMDDAAEAALGEKYKVEFRYLLRNKERWQAQFVAALKEYFEEAPSAKEFVVDTMYLFASSSEGISREEDSEIEDLAEQLGIDLKP